MFTPQEINKQEFAKAVFGGYDMTAVDNFLEKLAADYAELYKENGSLKSKIKFLVEKVEEYRSSEEAMRMAILSAQKMGDDIIEQANIKSAEIIANAERESDGKLLGIDEKIEKEASRLYAAQLATRDFVNSQRELLAQQTARLDELERSIGLEDAVESVPDDAKNVAEDVEIITSDNIADTNEDAIIDVAREIDSAVSKLTNEDFTTENVTSTEPVTEVFRRKTAESNWSDDDEPTSTRPKFDFDNLQFGENYNNK